MPTAANGDTSCKYTHIDLTLDCLAFLLAKAFLSLGAAMPERRAGPTIVVLGTFLSWSPRDLFFGRGVSFTGSSSELSSEEPSKLPVGASLGTSVSVSVSTSLCLPFVGFAAPAPEDR